MQNAKDVFHWSGGMRQPPRAGGGVPAFREFVPPPTPVPAPSPPRSTPPLLSPKVVYVEPFF